MSDPYASHLTTLRFVLALLRPTWVLELGVGLYSTPALLDCRSVEQVHSIETDEEWAERIRHKFINDPRLAVEIYADVITGLPADLMTYDLVFIDNADNATDRLRTIYAVLERDHPVTVIHDADFPPYRRAIDDLAENVRTFADETPHTAVCW